MILQFQKYPLKINVFLFLLTYFHTLSLASEMLIWAVKKSLSRFIPFPFSSFLTLLTPYMLLSYEAQQEALGNAMLKASPVWAKEKVSSFSLTIMCGAKRQAHKRQFVFNSPFGFALSNHPFFLRRSKCKFYKQNSVNTAYFKGTSGGKLSNRQVRKQLLSICHKASGYSSFRFTGVITNALYCTHWWTQLLSWSFSVLNVLVATVISYTQSIALGTPETHPQRIEIIWRNQIHI